MVRGSVDIAGSISYVGQIPFLLKGTVRQNVLFGAKLDLQKLENSLRAAGLESDLDMMADGDESDASLLTQS